MPSIEARGAQLVRKTAKKDVSYVQTLSFELGTAATDRIGDVFGVISVDTKDRKGAALAAHIEDAFARSADDAIRCLPTDSHHDQIFEAAIGGVNKALSRLFGEFGLEIESNIVTSAIVAFKGSDTVVATWGRPSVLLFHPANSGVRILDLADGGAEQDRPQFRGANAFRCYGSVIAGRIGARDRMLLSTQDLRHFIDNESIANAVLSADPASASIALDRILPDTEGVSIASLVLDSSPFRYLENGGAASYLPIRTVKSAPSSERTATELSLDRLSETSSKTGETLSPSVAGVVARAVSFLKPIERQKPAQTPVPAIEPKVRPSFWKMVWVGLIYSWKAVSSTARFTYSMFHPQRRTEALAQVVAKYTGLSTRSRALLFSAIGLAVLAQGSVVYSAVQNRHEESVAAYERSIDDISQTIDAAESSMIYRDETRAGELMSQAVAAIAALPIKTPEQIEKKKTLEAKIETTRADMRREVALSTPQTVATVAESGSTLPLLTFDGKNLWTTSSAGTVLRVAPSGQATDSLGNAGSPLLLVPISNGALAIAADGNGTFFNGTTSKTQRVALASGDTPTEASLYNGRLYILDAGHSRIMRHTADTQGFGEGQHYLKDGTDLSGTVSMAIDSTVWTLKGSGSIIRVIQGKQEPFSAAPADPAITKALRVRTPSLEDDLFVLDSSPSRIIRYSKKTGAMLAQYRSPDLTSATDLAIEKGGTTAYVTVGNKILKFSLPAVK